jgi:hypothetical protein
MSISHKEKLIQDALGTTPYILNLDKQTVFDVYQIIGAHIQSPRNMDYVGSFISGVIIGGLTIATTKTDIDRVLNGVHQLYLQEKVKNRVDINWSNIIKDVKKYINNK